MLSRVGISLEDDLLEQFDELIKDKGYSNRSEAIRDLIRDAIVNHEWERPKDDKPKIAVATLVYDHDEHELGHKLTHEQHDNHEIVISSMHVHMDLRNCLEVLILKGPEADVLRMGNNLISTKGVKLGRLFLADTGEGL